MTDAGSSAAARSDNHRAKGGSTPASALRDLIVRPVPFRVARQILVDKHYLHSLPGGTRITFGVFVGPRLLGALALGVGPFNVPSLVDGATADDCLTLTRLWLSDELPRNSESRVLGITIRGLRRHTALKFLVSYADPSQSHLGTIYQASNWLYTGLSDAMPLYDIGDGKVHHSRSLSHAFGSHSVRHFAGHGVTVRLVPQARKHRYLYFLDPAWISRLRTPTLTYPKKEALDGPD